MIQLVVFILEGQRYALHLPSVERVLPMASIARLPNAPDVALGVIDLHGRVMPVVDLRRRFGLPPHDYGLGAHLLVVRTARRTLAIAVEEVIGVREIAPEAVIPPDAVLPGIGHVAGIAALPDGLLLIHDLDTLLSLGEERRLTRALEGVKL